MNLRIKTRESILNTLCLDMDISKMSKSLITTSFYNTHGGAIYEIHYNGDHEILVNVTNTTKMTVYKNEAEEIY